VFTQFTHVPVPEDKWQDMAVIAIVPPAQLASWSQALCDFELKIQAWHGWWMSELHLLVVYFSLNLPMKHFSRLRDRPRGVVLE
jgi:hypothetical protein